MIDLLRALVGRLHAHRDALGRAQAPFEGVAACSDAFEPDGYRRLADAGVTCLLTQPWLFYGARPDDLDQKLDGVRRFADDVFGAVRG